MYLEALLQLQWKDRGMDVLNCSPFMEFNLLHLLIKMDWQMDMDLAAIAELQRFARYSVRTTAKITSLRVQNIEVIPPSLEKESER